MKLILKIALILVSLFFYRSHSEEPPLNPDLNISFEGFQVTNTPSEANSSQKNEVQNSENSRIKGTIDNFFNRSVKNINKLKSTSLKIIEGQQSPNIPSIETSLKVEAPLVTFPDPLFYNVVYQRRPQFITYAYIYNDKTNKDNDSIPPLLDYNPIEELFILVKDKNQKDKFYELYKVGKKGGKFDINAQDKNGNTFLLIALRNSNFEVFNFLLMQGANPNICNNYNICPIQMAIYSENFVITEALAKRNINLRAKDKNGLDVMRAIIYYGKREILEIILKRYMRYPVDITERQNFMDFAQNLGRIQIYNDLKLAFNL